jgi:RNA polymerase sigma-70 factor (sigma-E family)
VGEQQDREFTAFVQLQGDGLLRLARYLINDPSEAEDALQTALVRLLRSWDRGLDNPLGYARQVLVNLAKDRGRRRHLVPVPVAEPTSSRTAPDLADALVAQQRLAEMLVILPARQRVTVVLRVIVGMSEAETAALLGCANGTVKSNLARGLDRLRASLEADETAIGGHR